MRAEHPSGPLPADPSTADSMTPLSSVEDVDSRPNRAARRGKGSGTVPEHHHVRGAAPHARGAQGRRINPVRRTG
jgi:hypothetical protein